MNQICDQNPKAVIASSAPLGWDGVSIARGRMNAAVFDQTSSPQHHFCMIVRNRLNWECGSEGKRMKRLTTLPGHISIYPADLTTTRCIKTPFEFVALTLAPERIAQGLRDVRSENRMEFRIHHNVDDPQLRGLMNTLLGEAEGGNPNGRLFVESLAQALSIHYVKQYSVKRNVLPENRYSLSAHQRRRILDFIEDNLMDELSLDAMAKEVGLSKYYFCTLFKQSIGKTPY